MKNYAVFDLDGTIADTQKIHEQVESDFLRQKGIYIEPILIGKRFAGRTPQEWIAEVLTEEKIDFSKIELEDFVSKKDKIVIDLLTSGQIELMPFAYDTLKYLNQKGYKIGISSGACRKFIDEFIKYFKFEGIVDATTSSNEVKNKKPNPDVFLETFKKLEELYGTCSNKYVIGDGWSDMEGGHRAGAQTIWLNCLNKQRLNNVFCNFEIKTLKELQDIL